MLQAILLQLLLLIGSSAILAFGQAVPPPLNVDKVKELWRLERSKTLDPGETRKQVEQLGVDFEIDSAFELEAGANGMPSDLVRAIRTQLRVATLVIECAPDCDIFINGKPIGSTSANSLTIPRIPAGVVRVEVGAKDHKSRIATVELTPGERKTLDKFTLEPLKSTITLNCDPVECSAHIEAPDAKTIDRKTPNKRLQIPDLTQGEYIIVAQAEGYLSQQVRVSVVPPENKVVSIKLDRDEFFSMSEIQFLDRIAEGLGGEAGLRVARKLQSLGRMTLVGDPPNIGNYAAQITEYFVSPDKLRWDLSIAGPKWNVMINGPETSSDGDKRYKGSDFAQELESSVRQFADMQLPVLLDSLRSGYVLKKERSKDGFTLVASSPDQKYTLQTDPRYRPTKVLKELLTGTRSKSEMEFARYKPVKDSMIPYSMTLRYPDRPKHQLNIEFDKIDPTAVIKDSTFKSSALGGVIKLLPGKSGK